MLCHPTRIRGLTADSSGRYLATTGLDRLLRVWDLRKHQELISFKLPVGLANLHFSQTGLLGESLHLVEHYSVIRDLVQNLTPMFLSLCAAKQNQCSKLW